MLESIESQVISAILLSQDEVVINELCNFDASYYTVFKPQIQFILDHRAKYGNVPDPFTFDNKEFYNDRGDLIEFQYVEVRESLEYLKEGLKKNKKLIIYRETFNKNNELGADNIDEIWDYVAEQSEQARMLSDNQPMNIVAEAKERSEKVLEWSKQQRIPTGFNEIDKLTYGGLSTVEELLVLVARTNTGKSWVCTRMMEAAQKAGFPVAYYSPEMQAAYLATRFDTWRGHYKNSELFRGLYDEQYLNYISSLSSEETGAYIIEDKDMPEGVSPRHLEAFIQKNHIKLLIIDGISYMQDDKKSFSTHEKYAHICHDLFQISKKHGCAVVVAAQANRDTKESKDEKGIPFPTIYNISGSDAIGQIATQIFSLRQIFDKHVFEFRLEKARMAANGNEVLSYSWDVNTGNMQYLPGGADEDPVINLPDSNDIITPSTGPVPDDLKGIIDLEDPDDVEF